jgi:hypothetical protein
MCARVVSASVCECAVDVDFARLAGQSDTRIDRGALCAVCDVAVSD